MVQNNGLTPPPHALLKLFWLGLQDFPVLSVKVSEGNRQCCYSIGIPKH